MKRPKWIAVIGFALACLLAANLASAAEPADILTNGGFEQGVAGWTADAKHELLDSSAEAHSGEKCLSGEVLETNQSCRLRRSLPVTAGNRYQFEIWARATNRTKLVLWVQKPGRPDRESLAQWANLPRQWRKFSVPITVDQNGLLLLELIAPSSHGGVPGRIWIDDIALYETEMPPLSVVSDGLGFSDEPALARAGEGSFYLAYNGYRDGDDSLQVARVQSQGKRFETVDTWQVFGGRGTYVLGPAAASLGSGAVVCAAIERDKNWDIYAVSCHADGPSEPIRITSDPGVDIKPAVAVVDSTAWIAWESNRNGCRQILATTVRDGRASQPVALSEPGVSSYSPTIAALKSGQVCVAWHSFRENNYDIYLRRLNLDGSWAPETRLTKAASIDRHASLAAHGDDLWLVYENAQIKEYHIGSTNSRRLIGAKVTVEGLLGPSQGGAASPLNVHCEGASTAIDSTGRLWVTFRKPRERIGWDAYLTCLEGGRWRKPMPLSGRKGLDRRSPPVIDGDRVVVAFQADNAPASYRTIEAAGETVSDVCLASVPLGVIEAPSGVALEPLVEPDESFEAGQLRIARGEDRPTQSLQYQGESLKLFFGDLHEHTDISVCNRSGDQSVDESYQHMRDIARHDFACVTDHGYNISPYLWNHTAKLARVNDDPDRFLTFLAEEWTSTFEEYSEKHPYGFYGHHNLILADSYFPRWWNARNYQTPADIWEDLAKMNANFVHIPHQVADTGNVPTAWDYTDEVAQPVAEIFQVRGSYEYKGTPREAGRSTPEPGYFLQDAWARGIVIGVIASPDHGGGYGKACVFAPELTREAILDAIRARRCYGTTGAKIFLDVRVAGHLMGEKVADVPPDSVEVKIHAECPGKIARIDVCRNNRFVYTTSPDGDSADLVFIDRRPEEGRGYYYVRVILEDEEIAWSSPVWFGAE